GEGYLRAPIALFGTLIGFGVGFFTWQGMYLEAIRPAPIAWLPETLGYGGALTLHLVVLSVIAIFLLRFLPTLPSREAGKISIKSVYETVFVQRWNPLFTGALVGIIGTFAYFRVNPLGVT
ncbi:MAG TPA: YeeE/YedE thiosulfate transporter family protein, partial [Aggregatilineales bacterium]|nr:YeeE/YedE thiosulfate transporter family protein [Aggregatilineales bacterium]